MLAERIGGVAVCNCGVTQSLDACHMMTSLFRIRQKRLDPAGRASEVLLLVLVFCQALESH